MKKLTDNKWLNLFEKDHQGKPYYFTSRKNNPDVEKHADAVIIAAFHWDGCFKAVVTKQFRPAIGCYEYGFPAGLIDHGETVEEAAKRELKEETGLDLRYIYFSTPMLNSSSGMTDEKVIICSCRCDGVISKEYLEKDEDIEVMLLNDFQTIELLRQDIVMDAKAYLILSYFAKGNQVWTGRI